MKTQLALVRITKAVRRLEHTTGPRARKTARAEMLAALRSMKTAMNTDYPAVKKPKMQFAAAYVEIKPHKDSLRFAQIQKAGIRVVTREIAAERITRYYAPRWAVEAPPDTTLKRLKEARRSVKVRKALSALASIVGRDGTGSGK